MESCWGKTNLKNAAIEGQPKIRCPLSGYKPTHAFVPSRLRPEYDMAVALSSSPTLQPVPMLDFSRQYAAIRDEVLAAIQAVCDSQRFILGPAVASFEAAAARACGTPHAVGCASGTDALWLALAAAGIGPGDRVVTTPFSFFATASAILRTGATPLFADIDPDTFNLSPTATAKALENGAKAVLPVHLYGQCADMDAFAALQRQHPGLLLLEDAAQAFGATWNHTPAGALGDAAAFSFYPTKNLSAFGDAGLLTTRDPILAERAASLRAHGMRRRYFHDEVGGNSRLDTLQAAVLEVKLRFLPQWNAARRGRAATYHRLFHDAGLPAAGIVLPHTDPRAGHVFHQYVIRAPRRDALRQHLTDLQIGTEIYYPLPLHLQTALAPLGYRPGDFPEAERAAAEVLALPLYPELRTDEQATVVEAIAAFYP
jgi:dTDP-4-amino-4,6-dideoxygalactose transaminase